MEQIGKRLKSWASILDGETRAQAARTASLPIVHGHVALMPDAHLGIGATVGSVIPTKGAIIPSAVGVDIGCGMVAAETNLSAGDLPDDLKGLLSAIEKAIPAGVGKGHSHEAHGARWLRDNPPPERSLMTAHLEKTAIQQLGTLGSGNHFGELCIDERQRVWWVLHSGSRGPGNQLAQAHIRKAKGLSHNLGQRLEDPDLAWFLEGTTVFDAYIGDLLWAQRYAAANRRRMVDLALDALGKVVGRSPEQMTHRCETVNCHHNYAAKERHGQGEDSTEVWVTRKGAIRAGKDELGVLPGSMGDRSYVVRGLGNTDAWESAPHGAGRLMSRRAARKAFNGADLAQAMGDRTWLADRADRLIDEHPRAYKPIATVLQDSKDLVEVEHELVQVLNFKGT